MKKGINIRQVNRPNKCLQMANFSINFQVNVLIDISLVTQPMLQRRPNRTELRSMDSYILGRPKHLKYLISFLVLMLHIQIK